MKNFKLTIILFTGTLFFCWVQYLFPGIFPAVAVMVCTIATFAHFDEEWQMFISNRFKNSNTGATARDNELRDRFKQTK